MRKNGVIIHHLFRILTGVCIALFISAAIPVSGQNLPPLPVPGGTLFRYTNDTLKLNSVAVAGPFNDWKKNANVFSYNPEKKYWECVVKLKPGTEQFYKLVLNDNIWITDPSAPDVTEDEWRNGIVIPQEYGAPYVVSQQPARNKRIEKLSGFTFTLKSDKGVINPASIKVLLNGKKQKFAFNKKTSVLSVQPPGNLKDGEHTLVLSFADTQGNLNSGYETRFFLDRYIQNIATPAFYDSSIMYEVFIRKFRDSNGDGIGDFNGLTASLGYLHDTLGVNVLWLMPFNPSPTEHGYSITDYYSIEPALGTFGDYLNFLKEAKKRNMRVLMDFVINHTDSIHPFFLSAYKNPQSKYSAWFQFTNKENSDWKHFGVERKMPKLEFNNPEVQEYFLKVASFWLDPNKDGKFDDGIDGFRCDAAKEVPHTYWNKFRKFVKHIRSDVFILGEVWDNARYLIPFFKEEFDALFDYPHYYSFREVTRNRDAAYYSARVDELATLYPSGHQLVRFLSNHDNPRPITFSGSYDNFVQGLGLIFSMPGIPMIYYGDELGYTGDLPPENVRQNFEWNKLHSANDTIFALYKELIQVRKSQPVLSARNDKKSRSLDFLSGDFSLLGFLRYNSDAAYAVVANLGDTKIKDAVFMYNGPAQIPASGIFTPVFQYKGGTGRFGAVRVESFSYDGKTLQLNNLYLEPGGYAIVKLR